MIGINRLLNPHHQNVPGRSRLARRGLPHPHEVRQDDHRPVADPIASLPSTNFGEAGTHFENRIHFVHFSV